MLLDGRVAVVTGGGTGIGQQLARRFASEGAAVVIADIDADAAAGAADELSALGHHVAGVRCDVVDETSVAELVESTVSTFGSLDVYVNNAGFTRDSTMRKMALDDFVSVLHVHVVGAWLGVRAASARMRSLGNGGSIINMSSISGKVGNPGQTNYSAAKAAVVGLTKAAAKEVARHRIRVNAIQPGLIESAMTAKVPPEILADRLTEVPLGRIGQADDVAGAALYLASDLSAYVTGTVTEVSGGRHM